MENQTMKTSDDLKQGNRLKYYQIGYKNYNYTTFGKYCHWGLLNACGTLCYWLSARESKPIAALY